jgi:hypothetical protein
MSDIFSLFCYFWIIIYKNFGEKQHVEEAEEDNTHLHLKHRLEQHVEGYHYQKREVKHVEPLGFDP